MDIRARSASGERRGIAGGALAAGTAIGRGAAEPGTSWDFGTRLGRPASVTPSGSLASRVLAAAQPSSPAECQPLVVPAAGSSSSARGTGTASVTSSTTSLGSSTGASTASGAFPSAGTWNHWDSTSW